MLGLFDLLSATPSRSTGDEARPNAKARRSDATPSKRNSSASDIVNNDTHTTPSAGRLHSTPSSTRKNKMLLDELPGMMTPLHKRDRNSQPLNKTPSSRSVSKLHFATPAFLRRSTAPLPAVDENGEWKVEPIKLPRKPLVRGLSNMVASLRKLEEEALDDELDAMREMEMEASGSLFAPPPSRSANSTSNNTTLTTGKDQIGQEGGSGMGEKTGAQQEKDTAPGGEEQQQERPERPVLLGGFDDEDLYDSQDEQQLDRGQPLRVFKKKGQKRTTRRVNMRPSRIKRPSVVSEECSDDGEIKSAENDEVVPETQFDATKLVDRKGDDALLEGGSYSDFEGSEFENDNDDHDYDEYDVDDDRKKTTKKARASTVKKDGKAGGEQKDEGLVRKGLRKVKATAHANFKRLKLRNSGAKGGPAHNSRFRRRR